jgi:hypothetical protein
MSGPWDALGEGFARAAELYVTKKLGTRKLDLLEKALGFKQNLGNEKNNLKNYFYNQELDGDTDTIYHSPNIKMEWEKALNAPLLTKENTIQKLMKRARTPRELGNPRPIKYIDSINTNI